MNKLLMFPIAFLFIIALFTVTLGATKSPASSEDFSQSGEFVLNGTDDASGDFSIEGAETVSFDIWGVEGLLVLLSIGVAVGIVAGIKILGSGVDALTHALIFNGIIYFGIWAALTIISSDIMFENGVMGFTWMGLTLMFVLGFTRETQEGGE